jgi:hypothetical protein
MARFGVAGTSNRVEGLDRGTTAARDAGDRMRSCADGAFCGGAGSHLAGPSRSVSFDGGVEASRYILTETSRGTS